MGDVKVHGDTTSRLRFYSSLLGGGGPHGWSMRCDVSYDLLCFTHLDDLEALAGLALSIGNRDVRQQRRVADDRRKRVAVVMSHPFARLSALSVRLRQIHTTSSCPHVRYQCSERGLERISKCYNRPQDLPRLLGYLRCSRDWLAVYRNSDCL